MQVLSYGKRLQCTRCHLPCGAGAEHFRRVRIRPQIRCPPLKSNDRTTWIFYLCKAWVDLKRQCHEIFCNLVFQESNPFESLINCLKWFWWKIRFCEDSAQYHTAHSAGNNFVFAVLSFPSMRILNFFRNICVISQHSPTFCINILKG